MLLFGKIEVNDYLKYEQDENINYLLPGDSNVAFTLNFKDLYQTSNAIDNVSGSLSSHSMINEEDLIYGRMPETNYEIVLDKMVTDNVLNSESRIAKMAGLLKAEELINKEISASTKLPKFKIVGIVDKQSPSIYANENIFVNLLANVEKSENGGYQVMNSFGGMTVESSQDMGYGESLIDYNLYLDKITLIKGRMPENDYEVIVNNSKRYEMPLNKEINIKVNDTKLKVVGYYDSQETYDYYFVNNNTVKYKIITESDSFTAYAKDKEMLLTTFQEEKLNVSDTYTKSRDTYMREKQEQITGNLIFTGIILAISLIEIFLMMRSSFLSRVKEIGILRAIGVKKKDIYKMFLGETIAITTLASLPGIVLMAYILNVLTGISMLERMFIVNTLTVCGSILFVYMFNIIVGLLPVFNVLRKRPAQILSRHDLQ